MNPTMKNAQNGIGVIEVMVAAIIFALGIVALIQLQGVFFKNSSDAHSLSVAATLAEEKLEDLRSFDGTVFSYLDILDNSGGEIASGAVALGNTDYTLTWDVTGYYYNAGVLTSIDPADADVEHKSIEINVSWLDREGVNQVYTLSALINSNAGTSGGLLANNTGGSGEKPKIPHVELPAPEVLRGKLKDPPPESFDGTNAEWNVLSTADKAKEYAKLGWCNVETYGATNSPDPDLDTDNTLDNVIIVRYNVIVRFASTKYRKYNPCSFDYANDVIESGSISTSTQLVKIKEEEFVTINCECELADSGPGFDQDGISVTKAKTGVPTGNNQNEFCNLCCRDHHENITGGNLCNAGANPEYCIDPFRTPNADFTASDHMHFLDSDLRTVAVSGDIYPEACRLKRVNGFYRVVPDWRMIAHSILVEDDLNDLAAQTSYESYIGTQINQSLTGNAVSSWSYASGAIPLNQEQMMSRSIYLDYLTPAEIAAASPATNGDEIDISVDFYEYKTTQLSDWTTVQGAVTDTQITSLCDPNNSAINACTDDPSISAIVNNASVDKGIFRFNESVSGDIDIVSSIGVSNSGVVSEPAIDNGDLTKLSASYDVAFGAGPPAPTRSIQMASRPAFTCADSIRIQGTTYIKTAENVSSWPSITLACSPDSGNASSCELFSSDTNNVTVTPSLGGAILSCTYGPVGGEYLCPSVNGLSGGNRLDVTGTYSCSIESSYQSGGLSCDLVCN